MNIDRRACGETVASSAKALEPRPACLEPRGIDELEQPGCRTQLARGSRVEVALDRHDGEDIHRFEVVLLCRRDDGIDDCLVLAGLALDVDLRRARLAVALGAALSASPALSPGRALAPPARLCRFARSFLGRRDSPDEPFEGPARRQKADGALRLDAFQKPPRNGNHVERLSLVDGELHRGEDDADAVGLGLGHGCLGLVVLGDGGVTLGQQLIQCATQRITQIFEIVSHSSLSMTAGTSTLVVATEARPAPRDLRSAS